MKSFSRGVGKTVLLNEVKDYAESRDALTDLIEVSKTTPLSKALIATLRATLLKLDRLKGRARRSSAACRCSRAMFQRSRSPMWTSTFSIDLDPEAGVADSGNLTRDPPELFVAVGEAAAP